MHGRREPGTEPSGVVGGCGKRSPFSFYFILIGLLDALFAFGAVAGLSLVSFSFLFRVVLYPMFFFCFFVGSCMPGFETTGSPSFFFSELM